MNSATVEASEMDEWDVHNDDGFIFKRQKRLPLDPDPGSVASSVKIQSDRDAAYKLLRERKKETLLKIKVRYQREIDHWDNLSNTLRTMEETTRLQQQREQTAQFQDSLMTDVRSFETNYGSLVDDLLMQAENQDAIIRDVSNLCDIAEGMCNMKEEQLNHSFFDLPIWVSPEEFMSCDIAS